MKETTETAYSAHCLDKYLKFGISGQLTQDSMMKETTSILPF
jgi:hypothetical protein